MEKVVFQQFQFDRGLSRLRKNPVEHMPTGFLAEAGGDKSIQWEVRKRLERIKGILIGGKGADTNNK